MSSKPETVKKRSTKSTPAKKDAETPVVPKNAQPATSTPSSKSKSQDAQNDLEDLDFGRYFHFAWISVVITLIGIGILNPDVIVKYFNDFIGVQPPPPPQPRLTRYLAADVERREAVVGAFKHAWRAYERDAMGSDEYHPISQKGTNLTKAGGIGYTVVDSLDTMLLMGLEDDYGRARKWVDEQLTFDRDAPFNTFETTIRVLGGLLSAYHLTNNDTLYLDRAIDLADRIMPVFQSPGGLPYSRINLAKRRGMRDAEFPAYVSTAEATTLQLEFKYLSQLTNTEDYWRKTEKVMEIVKKARQPHGLASIFMHHEAAEFVPSAIRLGSRGDSFYEYLLKQYIQTGQTEDVYREMYDDAVNSIHAHLIQQGMITKMIYTAELIPEQEEQGGEISWRRTPKQDHLVCFLGGHLMLGATITGATGEEVSVPPGKGHLSLQGSRDWKTGTELIKTCVATHDTTTGLAPEIVYFRIPGDNLEDQTDSAAPADWYIRGGAPGTRAPFDARYILRPETVESLFVAFRLTGEQKYRDDGWKIFQAIEQHCRVPTGGYASIVNVDDMNAKVEGKTVEQEDKMETFLLSETLKYLFLLFEESTVLPLDEYVFNTEGHPLPIFEPTFDTGFS